MRSRLIIVPRDNIRKRKAQASLAGSADILSAVTQALKLHSRWWPGQLQQTGCLRSQLRVPALPARKLTVCVTSLWQQITKPETIPVHTLADGELHRLSEVWPIKNEGMKLAVLAAGIDMRRQLCKKVFIDHHARK